MFCVISLQNNDKSAAKQSAENLEVLEHKHTDTVEEFRRGKSVTVTWRG